MPHKFVAAHSCVQNCAAHCCSVCGSGSGGAGSLRGVAAAATTVLHCYNTTLLQCWCYNTMVAATKRCRDQGRPVSRVTRGFLLMPPLLLLREIQTNTCQPTSDSTIEKPLPNVSLFSEWGGGPDFARVANSPLLHLCHQGFSKRGSAQRVFL